MVTEILGWKLHQPLQKLWEDEWERWMARRNAGRETRTPREKKGNPLQYLGVLGRGILSCH